MDGVLKRIKEIIEKEGISPSELADTIGIGRPLLSHVLSGRNNPSLQLVLKILESYPAYSANWLLTGKADSAPLTPTETEDTKNKTVDSPVQIQEKQVVNKPKENKAETQEGLPEVVLMMFDDKTYEAYKLRK